jgi:serine/threonine protein kinase
MEDLTGRQFGQYRIVAPLGEGGMADVYKAYQASVDRYVAIKVLPQFHSRNREFLQRFKQEAQVLAKLQHPFVVPILDFGEADGYTFLVMTFIEGGTLKDLLTGEPIPLSRAGRIISQVGSALGYAHSLGMVHRDLKPTNILIDLHGNSLLTDFGVAKILEGSAELTRTGGILGTPVYMSPEQGLGERIGHKTDIYSLGVVLYEMVTGRAPFQAETPFAVIYKHIHDPLPPPSSINPGIPEDVERVVLKSLAKDPDHRYENVNDMVDALAAAIPPEGYLRIEVSEVEETFIEALPPVEPIAEVDTPEEIIPEPVGQEGVPIAEAETPEEVLPEPVIEEPIPQPIGDERETLSRLRGLFSRRLPWLLGGVGIVVIVAIFLLNGLDGGDRAENGLTAEPTSAGFVASQPTAIPTSPTHTGPTSTPITSLPRPITNFLVNPRVEYHEPFDDYNQDSFSWGNTDSTEINNGFLTFYGDRFTDWGGNDPTFGYRTNLYEGEAILISIKFNHPTDLVGDVINGEWQTEDHRGFGFDEQLRPEMFNGTEAGFPHDNFDERIEWRVDTWYHALIVIGENEEFSLRIWEIDNPSSYNYYRSIHDGTWGLPDWGNREWTFNFTVNFGEVVLDAFTHITHDGFIW